MFAYLTGKSFPAVVTQEMVASINNQNKKIPTKELDLTDGTKIVADNQVRQDIGQNKMYSMLINAEDLMDNIKPFLVQLMHNNLLMTSVKSLSGLSSTKIVKMASYDFSTTLDKIVLPLVFEFEHEIYSCKYLEFSGGVSVDRMSNPLATDECQVFPKSDSVDIATGKLLVSWDHNRLNVTGVTIVTEGKSDTFTDLKVLVPPLQIRGRVDVKFS